MNGSKIGSSLDSYWRIGSHGLGLLGWGFAVTATAPISGFFWEEGSRNAMLGPGYEQAEAKQSTVSRVHRGV